MKTCELTGELLNHFVHVALCKSWRNDEKYGLMYFRPSTERNTVSWDSTAPNYCGDWNIGGPLIGQENFAFTVNKGSSFPELKFTCFSETSTIGVQGPTHLIAAMRCIVESRLGSDVEINAVTSPTWAL